MKKLFIILIIPIVILCSGCSIKETIKETIKNAVGTVITYGYNQSPEGRAEAITKKIVKAFDNQDEEGVKKLFAKNVIDKCKDFDSDLKNAFSYYNTKSTKAKYDYDGEEADFNYGNVVRFVAYAVDLTCENGSYTIMLYICTDDDNDNSNIGIFHLMITRNEFLGKDNCNNTIEIINDIGYGIYCVS